MPKPLSSLYPLIVPRVLGAPAPLVDQAIVRAATEFCKETGLYQQVTTTPVRANRPDYDVEVPQGAILSQVLDVWHGDRQLGAVAVDQITASDALNGTAPAGTPYAFFLKDPTSSTITLYPPPDAAGATRLTIRAQYEIATGATSLPDFLVANHAYEVASGAVAYLALTPDQPFSNPSLAATELSWFRAAMSRGRGLARVGRSRRSFFVRPRRFA